MVVVVVVVVSSFCLRVWTGFQSRQGVLCNADETGLLPGGFCRFKWKGFYREKGKKEKQQM